MVVPGFQLVMSTWHWGNKITSSGLRILHCIFSWLLLTLLVKHVSTDARCQEAQMRNCCVYCSVLEIGGHRSSSWLALDASWPSFDWRSTWILRIKRDRIRLCFVPYFRSSLWHFLPCPVRKFLPFIHFSLWYSHSTSRRLLFFFNPVLGRPEFMSLLTSTSPYPFIRPRV